MFPTGMEIPAGGAPPEGSPVTTWDPPHRFVIRMEAPDGSFNALEYTIEARDGGTAHLRYVHSGILADELGGPVRRHRRAHRLLPAHARRSTSSTSTAAR